MTSTARPTNINQRLVLSYLSCLLLCLTRTTHNVPFFVAGFGLNPTTSRIPKSPIPLWQYYSSSWSSSSLSFAISKSSRSSRSSSRISSTKKSVDDEIREMEQQVLASAREKRDFDRLARALREDQEASSSSSLIPSKGTSEPFFLTPEDLSYTTEAQSQQLQVALASAVVTAVASFLLFSNVFITAILSAFVFWSANSDPLEKDMDENLLGAIARIVGRKTLQSYQQATPKVKAVARAVVTGEKEMALLKARIQELEQEEIQQLQQCIEVLEAENAALQNYKQQRELVDQNSHRFKLPEIKEMAREYNLPVGGTKDQVLMRLVQAGVIDLEMNQS